MNRTARYIGTSATVSVAATLVAVAAYLNAIGTSPPEIFTFTMPFSISPIGCGLPIAAAIGFVLSRVTRRSYLSVVFAAALLSAIGGATVALVTTRRAVHVSTPLATALLGAAWAIAATVSAAICVRTERLQPNSP